MDFRSLSDLVVSADCNATSLTFSFTTYSNRLTLFTSLILIFMRVFFFHALRYYSVDVTGETVDHNIFELLLECARLKIDVR